MGFAGFPSKTYRHKSIDHKKSSETHTPVQKKDRFLFLNIESFELIKLIPKLCTDCCTVLSSDENSRRKRIVL